MTKLPLEWVAETGEDGAGWTVQNPADANIDAARGVAIREFSLAHDYVRMA
jgi:hypothetical protein